MEFKPLSNLGKDSTEPIIEFHPIDAFKDWFNEGKEDNNYADEDEIATISAINNPFDDTLTDMADDLSEEYLDIDLKADREIKASDIENYKTNVKTALGEKYEVGFDPDDYKPFIRPKGTKDEFKPVLNNLGDATTSEIGERIWANSPTWLGELGGDIAGVTAGVKMVSKFSKHPAVLVFGGVLGATFGAGAGAGGGAGVQTLTSDEQMSNTRRAEIMKDAGVDAIVGNAVAIGLVGTVAAAVKGTMKASPFHRVRVGKDEYKEKTLYDVKPSTLNPLNPDAKRNNKLKEIAEAKAQTDYIFKTFGGKKEQDEIIELAGSQATKDVVRDYYAHSEKIRNAEIANSMQLTKNMQKFFNLDKQDSSDIYRFVQGGMTEIKKHYARIYNESKELVNETVGSQHVPLNTQTKTKLETLLDDAKYPTNVENAKLDEAVKNEFNKDYQELLEMTLSLFENTQGYKVGNLLNVQKKFNSFYIKHKKKFDVEQLKGLDTVKESIYDDIERGIKSSDIPDDKKAELNELWKWANDEYKNYKTIVGKKEIFSKLLDKDTEFDEMKFASNLIKNANKVDGQDFDVLGVFASELKKIDETKLDEFYKTLVNSFVTTSKKSIVHQNKEVEFMDFEKFTEAFNSIDKARLDSIFSHSPRGKEMLKHLRSFDELAKREGSLQKATIGDEYKMAEGQGDSRHLMQKLLYSTSYLVKSLAFDWWSKYALRSKAYESFVLDAMTKSRYEDVDQLIKKLDFEQRTIPEHKKVDIEQFKKDIENAKMATKKAVTTTDNAAEAKEVQEVSMAGLLEHKPELDVSVRNFDVEKAQVKELARSEGMDEDAISRINNFDDFAIEIKNFKQSRKEATFAENKNPSPEGYEDYIETAKKPEAEAESFVDETDLFNSSQEDFKGFLQKNEQIPTEQGEVQSPQTMVERAMARQNFDKELVERVYNEPENVLSAEAKEMYKPYKSMFTTFQGGKHQMSQIVPQYLDKVYTKEQLDGVTKITDYFGGGGTWGSFFAKINKFPNVKDVEINEFNELRALKISYLYHRPKALIETLKNDTLITDLIEGMKAISKDKGNNGSNGFIAPYINAMMTEYEQGVKGAVQITGDQKAALYLLADYGNASFATMGTKNIIENLIKQVEGVASSIAPLKQRGVKFTIKNRSSYEIEEFEQGSHVLAIVDPPYYLTSGYDIIKDGVMTKATTVGVDMYDETSKLLKSLSEAGNLGIYTDEAWEVKSVKLPKNFKRATQDGVSDYEILKDISQSMGDFFRVPEKIADRTEVLGFINSNGKKGKIDVRGNSTTKPSTSNDGGARTASGEHQGSQRAASRELERTNAEASTDSTKTQQNSDTNLNRADEPSQGVDEPAKPVVITPISSRPPQVQAEYAKETPNPNILRNKRPDWNYGSAKNPPIVYDEMLNLEKRYHGLKSHPRFNELMAMREGVGAVDSRYDNKVVIPKHEKEYNRGEGWVKEITPPIYEKTFQGEFKVSKQKVSQIKNGKFSNDLLDDLEADLNVLDEHPDWKVSTDYEVPKEYDNYKDDPAWIEANALFVKGGDNLAVGIVAGVDEDENGNITFDVEKFVLALGGYTALKATMKNKAVQKQLRGWASKAVQSLEERALSGDARAMALTGISPAVQMPAKASKNFVDKDGFYSLLEKTVDEKVGGKIDSNSLGAMLKKAGVKDDEIEWSGLGELMEQNPKLTKAQIEETIGENRLVVEVVKKSGDNSAITQEVEEDLFFGNLYEHIDFTKEQSDTIAKMAKEQTEISEAIADSGLTKEWKKLDKTTQESLTSSWKFLTDAYDKTGGSKYSEYKLPMGKNYQELLFRTPNTKGEADVTDAEDMLMGSLWSWSDITKAEKNEIIDAAKQGKSFDVALKQAGLKDFYTSANAEDIKEFSETARRFYDEYQNIARSTKGDNAYLSDHWSESNVLVFSRVDDRTIDNKRTLFIEELQSDWHQDGRKQGYVVGQGKKGVADAPFKKNWHELGVKRLIQEAVEKGYEKVAWTSGAQQAKRYSLEKELDTIVYNKQTGFIQGTNGGDEVVFKQVASDEEVEALMGKELTKRLIDPKNSTHEEIFVLKGDALKFGGDGMKKFYDEILPNSVKKLVKKYGSKPIQEELDDLEEMVWSFDVTAKMKEDIRRNGQPLYAEGGLGVIAGFDEDENGNITYDVQRAIAVAGASYVGLGAIKNINKKTLTQVMKKSKHTTEQIQKELDELDAFYNSKEFKNLKDEQKKNFETVFVDQKDSLIRAKGLNEFVNLIYGNNRKGAKKILVNHYGENATGRVTKEDIVNIGEVLRDGKIMPANHKGHEREVYELVKDDTKYKVVISYDKNKDGDVFNYYTNRSRA